MTTILVIVLMLKINILGEKVLITRTCFLFLDHLSISHLKVEVNTSFHLC